MKHTPLIAALVLGLASLAATPVFAADITTPPQALTLVDDSAFFGDAFGMNQASDTFADHFTFTVRSTPMNLDAIVASISRSAATGLDITAMGLYGTGGLVTAGTMVSTGIRDVWTLSANGLAAGNYYLQVSGSLVSPTSGAFGGSVMLAPVPEPAGIAMLLAGLGVTGMLARRRSRPRS